VEYLCVFITRKVVDCFQRSSLYETVMYGPHTLRVSHVQLSSIKVHRVNQVGHRRTLGHRY